MRDEHPFPKDYLWLKALGGMVLILCTIGANVWRCSRRQEEERSRAFMSRIERELAALPDARDAPALDSAATTDAVAPSAVPPGGPIRFEVVSGKEIIDVPAGGRVTLADATRLVIEPRPLWVFHGDGFHFRHASSISVARAGDETIVASTEGAYLALIPLPRGTNAAEWSTALADAMTAMDRAAPTGKPVRRSIAGKEVKGELRRAGQRHLEIFVAKPGGRPIGVFLYYYVDAPVGMEKLLSSIRAGSARRGIEFEISIDGSSEASVRARRGEPVAIAGTGAARKITVRERATLRRAMGGFTFEHSPQLSPHLVTRDDFSLVALDGVDVMIFLFRSPPGTSPKEMVDDMLGGIPHQDLGDVQRTFASESLTGRRYRVHLAGLALSDELYEVHRGGKHISVFVRYEATGEEAALRRVAPVVASVR